MTWTGYDANGNPIAGQSAGVLGVANGGTGLSSVASGNLLLGAGTSALTALAGSSSGDVVQWNGSAWAAAGLTLPITQVTAPTRLGSSAASIDISSIPATYFALLLLLDLRTDRAGQFRDNVYLRFNGDTTAGNYYTYAVRESGATPGLAGLERLAVTATGIEMLEVATAATAPADALSQIQVWIYGYAQTTYFRRAQWNGQVSGGTGAGTQFNTRGAGRWTNTAAAVNQITLLPVAGTNFVTGSAYALYGIGAAA